MSPKSSLLTQHARLILFAVILFVALTGWAARLALRDMKNDIKDWLPADFAETAELQWFRQHFLGEQFVVVSWPGCHGGPADTRFQLFLDKLQGERPPLADQASADLAHPMENASRASQRTPPGEMTIRSPLRHLSRPDFVGNRYAFVVDSDRYHVNWGGRREKWFKGSLPRRDSDGQPQPGGTSWFYITPAGDVYYWGNASSSLRSLWQTLAGVRGGDLGGVLVESLGPLDGPWYYGDPRRLRAQLFQTALTGPDVLDSLTRPDGVLADNPAEAWRRLTGLLFGPDRKQTCIVLTLTEVGRSDLHRVLGRGVLGRRPGRLYQIAQQCSLSPDQLRLGGPPVDNVAIDEEGSVTLARLSGLSIVLGLGLSLFCFRSVSATLIVFFVGVTSSVLSLALVYGMGSHVDSIMMAMPPLVFVLGLAGAAHIINYYHEAVDASGRVGAAERAIAHGWKPAILCNVTTAIGLGSLYTSELVPIRNFGVFSGIAVLATLLLLFTFLPAALHLWPPRRPGLAGSSGEGPQATARLLDAFWRRVGSVCIRHHVIVSVGWLILIVVVGFGVTRIHTSVSLLDLFPDDAKIIRDYAWFEQHLGPLVPLEIVLKVNPRALLEPDGEPTAKTGRAGRGGAPGPDETATSWTRLSFLERMELAVRVQQVIEDEFLHTRNGSTGRTISAATFAPLLPDYRSGTLSAARRGATSRMLEGHRQQFMSSDYLQIDPADGAELWRISLRIRGIQGTGESPVLSQLKQLVEPIVEAQRARERILATVIAQRQGRRPLGAKVLLLGVPAGRGEAGSPATDRVNRETDVPGRVPPRTSESAGAMQTRIFSSTLEQLLSTSRLRVLFGPSQRTWKPGELKQLIAQQDCVVLVAPSADELELARHGARALVDVRDHVVDPARIQPAAFRPWNSPDDPSIAAIYTGIVPVVYKARHTLLRNLIESTFWSFVTITPIMMLVSRSIAAGGIAMLPNVLPVLVVFGGMGWLGIVVDIGSMMTAGIALGVAVDDTIHYLNWFREELNRSGDRKQAILAAYRHCATPTLQAAVISGLGLAIFAVSPFTPTRRFGYLMLTILWLGLAAELLFFPALLAGPLGRAFQPRRGRRGPAREITQAGESPGVP